MESVGDCADLTADGYLSVAGTGSAEEMERFVRRVIAHHGGSVQDEKELQRLAARHCGSAGARVLAYRHLLGELRACSWVEWDRDPSGRLPSPTSPHAACSCEPHHASDSASAAALGSDFLGGWDGADLQPSAPPPAHGEEEGAADDVAAPARTCEVRLGGGELAAAPWKDFGGVGIFSPPFGVRNVFVQRPYVVVLRHPADPSIGIPLFQSSDWASTLAVAHAVVQNLQVGEGQRVLPELYHSLLGDPDMCASLVVGSDEGAAAELAEAGLAGAASSSSSGSGAASSSAAPAPPEPAEPEACDDCPICFSEIESTSAAMRCSGEAGRHHYFHSGCMQRWIHQCREGRSGPTCPVCRGQIQFHAQRLEAFLSSGQSQALGPEERTFLQQCADRLSGSGVQWGEVLTLENAKHWGGIAAAGGWGFMLGYTNTGCTLHAQFTLEVLPQEHRIAQSVGWVLGIIVRALREHQRSKRKRDDSD